jgi:hypothetical protein
MSLLALALLASPASGKKAKQESGSRWPAGTTITLRDFTNPKVFASSVETLAGQWNAQLPDGTRLVYVREEPTACGELVGLAPIPATMPEGEVWVCSQRSLAGAYGRTTMEQYVSGPLYGGFIQLGESGAGNRKEKQNTVCHELGHALGVSHNDSQNSCLSSKTLQTKPGKHDRAQLASS